MAATLSVNPSPVMIDIDAGQQNGEAEVEYAASGFVPHLWERKLGGAWRRRAIGSSTAAVGGWTVRLKVGEVYQVLMYDSDASDPNVAIDDPAPPVVRITTTGLAKRSPTTLIEAPEEFGPGGTFFTWNPRTTTPTRAVMQVGRVAPRETDDGVHVLPNPLGTVESDLGDGHALVFASEAILPGTDYWATLLVFDEDGNWQSRQEAFTTRQRTVEIILTEIRIINDGSPGHNRASFRLWVCEGQQFASACALSEREISDRPSPGEEWMEHIALSADCQVPIRFGPSPVTRDTRRVSVLTRGIAKSTIGTDDISGNFDPDNGFPANPPTEGSIRDHAFLHLPVGLGEEVEEAEISTYAEPLNNAGDNEFEYEVIGLYSVSYTNAP